jgi:branched-subunit amino acid transport protein
MSELTVWGVILALGLATYAMRIGGFLAADAMAPNGLPARLLRLAPGNLFIAFTAAGVYEGGWPSLAGAVAAVGVMAATRRDWAAMLAGFAAAAGVAWVR